MILTSDAYRSPYNLEKTAVYSIFSAPLILLHPLLLLLLTSRRYWLQTVLVTTRESPLLNLSSSPLLSSAIMLYPDARGAKVARVRSTNVRVCERRSCCQVACVRISECAADDRPPM